MKIKTFIVVIALTANLSSGFTTTLRVPEQYPTIMSAITVALSGDTVLVSPGVYPGNIDYLGKNIVVGSLFLTTGNRDYVSQTVIIVDTGSAVTFQSGEGRAAVLCGFTIMSGTGKKIHGGEYGGGIYISRASPIVLGNSIIRNHAGNSTCVGRGGGIAIRDSSTPLIVQNVILNNSAAGPCAWINYFGGGIWIDSTSNPVIGGSRDNANDISTNFADVGKLLYREGKGEIVNATYNYFGVCPPESLDIFPQSQFDISHCLDQPIDVEIYSGSMTSANQSWLSQNYPNPFNSTTNFVFRIANIGFATLIVYNTLGQEIATIMNENLYPGVYTRSWDASRHGWMPSGVYYYRLIVRGENMNFVDTKKSILIR